MSDDTQMNDTQMDAPMTAALLFGAHPEVDLQKLCGVLNARLAETGLTFAASSVAGGDLVILSHPACQLTIARNATALAGHEFGAAVKVMHRVGPVANSFADKVDQHRKHLFLTVTPRHQADALTDPLHLSLIALHRAVLALMELSDPLAIYWAQSRILLRPVEMAATVSDPFPVTLVTRPVLMCAGQDTNNRPLTCFAINQSDRFFGKPLVLEDTRMTPQGAATLSATLLQRRLAGGLPLNHGDVVALSAAETLYVRHDPASQTYPDGLIRLSSSPRARRLAPKVTSKAAPNIAPAMAKVALSDTPRFWRGALPDTVQTGLRTAANLAIIAACFALVVLFADTALNLAASPMDSLSTQKLN